MNTQQTTQEKNLTQEANDLQKNQFIFSIRSNGEVLGYVESLDGKLKTEGKIGDNIYNSWVDLIKGLQGHNIAIDNFYW